MGLKFKVCIFDVNGVLIDSNAANAQAMGRAFTDDPHLLKRIGDLYLTLTGIDRGSKIRAIQEHIIGRPFEEHEFELRWKRFKDLAHQSMLHAPLLPGAGEVLTELGRLEKIRAAVSNTPADELQEILGAHDLQSLLDITRGGGDWSKSETLVRLLQDSEFEASQCLFIGDGKGDLTAARNAGVSFVAIDPGTGEFDDEKGFDGPYKHLADWGTKVLGMNAGPLVGHAPLPSCWP
jgi:phosphoglycolate phosphatase-like HAD superfamily hydrolase